MVRIRQQRGIIDRKALTTELDELVAWEGYADRTRSRVLALFKKALQEGEAEVRRRFEEGEASGLWTVQNRSFLVDQLVATAYDFAERHAYPVANPSKGEQMCICAIGGYGRGQLAPFSDIDLMFLLPYKQNPHVEQVVEFMLYLLWDLGLKVGHSTRSVDEALRLAERDMMIRTSLLDARWLWGDRTLFDTFKQRFNDELVAKTGPEFVDAKLAERDERHERMGDSRYVLEPNIKEGKGGLRDLQTLFWMATYLYRVDSIRALAKRKVLTATDVRRYTKAEKFLWTVRCHLHYLTGRPEERLTFDVQTALAERMGYTDRAGVLGVERFMKHYFLIAKDVGDLTRVLCAVLEEQHKKKRSRIASFLFAAPRRRIPGFKVDGDRLTVESADAFKRDPIKLLRLFREAQRHDLDIHPHALRLVGQNLKCIDRRLREDPDANRAFIEMLTSRHDPGTALKRLNESGVFGRFVPDFGRVVAQMQYDMYHVYTVDEHTIRAIDILHRIETGAYADEMPVVTRVIHEVASRRALYVAVLLHDIAKGRGGDHSEIGARVARKLCPRFGLSPEETETVSWLVLHHLLMSRTAFKRNLEDPKAIADFAEEVQSPERLKLLGVLTAADIRAVGPGVWNNWKAGLLRDLYYRAMERLSGGGSAEERDVRVGRIKADLAARLKGWPPEEVEAHLERGRAAYWLGNDMETLVRHAEIVREAESRGLALHIDTRPAPERDVTEITVYTADHPGLFSQIAGAMSLSGASIVNARIATLANGMALDTFSIQDAGGRAFAERRQLESLWRRIEDALTGTMRPAREIAEAKERALPSRTRVFEVPPRVIIDNTASRTHTVIEVNGRDRLGFLHDVTEALTEVGLQISTARVATYGERAVDVFYVKDVYGLKVDGEDKSRRIRKAVLDAIAAGEERAAKEAAGRVAAAE
jgi:[protein-PII] uridylyltransferase